MYVDRRGGPLIRRGGRSSSGKGKPRFDASKLYAISSLSAANFFQTAVGGGELGAPTGFGAMVLVRRTAPLTTSTPYMVGSNANNGHAFYTDTTGYRWRASGGTGAFSYTAPAWMSYPSDVGQLDLHVGAYKPGGALQFWAGRELRGTATVTGYTPATVAAVIGVLSGNVFPGEVVGIVTYRGDLTDAQMRAVYDAVRVLGDVPTSIAGATVTHRQSLRDELAKLGVPVVNGQIAPASLSDTVTAANVDAMLRNAAPTVKVIDPSVDGRKTYGVLGFGPTTLLQTAAGIRGASAFTVAWFGIANALDGTNRTLLSTRVASDGYRITHNTSFTSLWIYDGAAALIITGGPSLPVGVPAGVVATWAAGVPKIFVCTPSGVVETTGTTGTAGYTPSAEPMRIGDSGAGGDEALNSSWFGSTGMDGAAATLSQVQAWWAAVQATGRIQAIAGAQHTWDPHADIIANGGPNNGIPASVQDRTGTDHLTKVGSLYVAQRAERLWAYEAAA